MKIVNFLFNYCLTTKYSTNRLKKNYEKKYENPGK